MAEFTQASIDKLSKMIRQARQERQLTQTRLADRLGVSLQTLQSWEQARHPPGSVSARRALKDHLGIDINQMLEDGELAKE